MPWLSIITLETLILAFIRAKVRFQAQLKIAMFSMDYAPAQRILLKRNGRRQAAGAGRAADISAARGAAKG
jgi:hypothetical protein